MAVTIQVIMIIFQVHHITTVVNLLFRTILIMPTPVVEQNVDLDDDLLEIIYVEVFKNNVHMGGVDLLDSVISHAKIIMITKK